jgi:hypothetical protein
MSEGIMTLELQLRSLEALTPRDPEPLVEPRMAEALRLRTVKLTLAVLFVGYPPLRVAVGAFLCCQH